MSDGGGPAELLRVWLEAQAGAMEDTAGSAAWERAEGLFQAWVKLLDGFGPNAGGTATPFDPAEWLKPADPTGMVMIESLLSGTGLGGLIGETSDRPGSEFAAYRAALDRLKSMTARAWLASFREFSERSDRLRREARRHGTEPPDWDRLSALWTEISDAEFARTQRSADYIGAQETVLAAGIALRRRVRTRVEELAELLGLPSRREIDDMAEELHALRRQLRGDRRS